MPKEWITDRPPTEADGDINGDVRIRRAPGSDTTRHLHWSYAGGAPWQHTSYWKPATEPTPTEPDRELFIPAAQVEELRIPFSSARRVAQIAFNTVDAETACLIALCNDGTLWRLNSHDVCWTELPAIPQS